MASANRLTEDLVERLCRGLDIAMRAVDEFGSSGYSDEERPENSFDADKPIAEAAMLLYVVGPAQKFPKVASRFNELAERLIVLARSDMIAASIALQPTEIFDLGFTHILLSKLGFTDERFDAFLSECYRSSCRDGKERLAFARVEQRWIKSLWLDDRSWHGWQADVQRSGLSHSVDMLRGRRLDVYGLTHLFMYCSDFGRCTPKLPRPKADILAESRCLLAKCLDTEDFDLAAELLAGWPFLKARWCPTSTFCFQVLRAVEDEVGVLPGGVTSSSKFRKLEGTEKKRYALATGYHTALVMGLLCAATLNSKRLPPVALPNGALRGAGQKLLDMVPEEKRCWRSIADGLAPAQKDAVSTFFLDLGLTRACRTNDFAAMQDLLRVGMNLQIPASPLWLQSAELLSRLGACAQLVA